MATTAAVPGWLRVPDDANALAPRSGPSARTATPRAAWSWAASPPPSSPRRFGTPLYVVDESDARARAARILAAFEGRAPRHPCGTTVTVYYAGKAFLSRRGRALGHRGGARGSTCAPAASCPSRSPRCADPRESGSTATTSPSTRSSAPWTAGVGAIILDSEIEIERVGGMPRRAPAAWQARAPAREQRRARLDARVPRDGAEDQKFGVSLDRAVEPRAPASARTTSLDFLGPALATSARRSSTPPGSPSRPSACSPRTPSSARGGPAARAGTSAAASASPTRRPTTPRRSRRSRFGIADAVASGVPRARRPRAEARLSSPAASIIGPAGYHAVHRRHRQAGADRRRGRERHYASGRRRHERQRPHRALRGRLLGAHSLPGVGCPARAVPRGRQALRVAATSSSTPSTCRTTSRPATCSRWPRPAPTAGPSPATTTT